LSGVRVVKAFARQSFEEEKFDEENQKKYTKGRYLLLMHALFWPITDIMCGAQMLGGFVFAGWLTINGEISIGAYVAYAGLVVWIIWPLRNLGRLIVQMSESLVSFGRVSTVVDQEREPVFEGSVQTMRRCAAPSSSRTCTSPTPAPTARPARRQLQRRTGAVGGADGRTGSGKSSLVNLLPRFYDYTGGRILLDGIELKEYPRHYLRRQIGIVEQEPFLFSRTVRDNITYGVTRAVPDDEVEEPPARRPSTR
jgi:ATP-binding cassette subfamily B protein